MRRTGYWLVLLLCLLLCFSAVAEETGETSPYGNGQVSADTAEKTEEALFDENGTVSADTADDAGETISYGSCSVSVDAAYVDLGEQQVTQWDEFMAFLDQMPQLEQVDMFATPVEARDIQRLTNAFPDVRFGWTISIGKGAHLIRTDATAFSTLHGQCSRHTSEDFDVLRYCTELRALDLGHNNITTLDFLAPLTELRILILVDNVNLGGDPKLKSIYTIGTLTKLEYMELFSCNLTDISWMANLTHLIDLNFAQNNVIDCSALVNLKQLKRLHLWQRNWSYRQLDLESKLPNTVIVNNKKPTANGWRTGPHYEIVNEIFHTGKYIPFADSYE